MSEYSPATCPAMTRDDYKPNPIPDGLGEDERRWRVFIEALRAKKAAADEALTNAAGHPQRSALAAALVLALDEVIEAAEQAK